MPRIRLGVFASCLLFVVPAIAQTFAPGGNTVVRDSNGQLIGQYDAATNQSAKVSTLINGLPVYFDLDRNELFLFNGLLYFDQPNCQGNAFADNANWEGTVMTPAGFAPDGTVRVAPTRTTSSHVVASYYWNGTFPCTNQTSTITALATQVGPNMKTRFTAPFTIGPGTVASAIVEVPANHWLLLGAIFAAVTFIALLRLRG